MTTSDAFRAHRLVWRFKKSGGNGRELMAVADLDGSVREKLLAHANLQAPEEPAFGLFRSDDEWVLITSRRIIWKKDGKIDEAALSLLSDATVDVRDLRTVGSKNRVGVLTIMNENGDRRQLALESGPPLSGAWNALKMAAGWKSEHQ